MSYKVYKRWGLIVNADKRKVMKLGREDGSVCKATVGRRKLKHVFQFSKVISYRWSKCCRKVASGNCIELLCVM